VVWEGRWTTSNQLGTSEPLCQLMTRDEKKRSVRRVRSFLSARDLRHVLPPSLRRSQAHRSHLHTGQLYIYYEYSKKTYKHPEHTEHTVTAVKVATTGPQLLQHPFRHRSTT
jgi:hypothetical protein